MKVMKLTVEVRTELFARHSEKKWTAKAFIAGAAVIEREYNPVLAAPDKPFPLKLALQIARDARDELAKIEGFEFIFTQGEIGPDFVTFEAPDRGGSK